MNFEWDPEKAAENLERHGVSFEEDATAFGDSLSLTIGDPDHSETEDRFVLLGTTFRGRLVVVVHTDRGENVRSSVLGLPTGGSVNPMSKSPDRGHSDMRDEYDFRGGTRGKYADRFAQGSNVVVLEPDVAAELRTPKAVNKALREYLRKRRQKSGAA